MSKCSVCGEKKSVYGDDEFVCILCIMDDPEWIRIAAKAVAVAVSAETKKEKNDGKV